MKAFIYKDEIFIRCVPGKNLFRSTMVHEAVNRGDIFALRVSDQTLTIIPGKSEVEHINLLCARVPTPLPCAPDSLRKPNAARERLAQLRLELDAAKFQLGDAVRLTWWTTTSRVLVEEITRTDPKAPWRYRLSGLGFYNEEDLMRA